MSKCRNGYKDFALALGKDVGDSGFGLMLLAVLELAAQDKSSGMYTGADIIDPRVFLHDIGVRRFYSSRFSIFDLPRLFEERYTHGREL